ncbi:hypothetical protein ACFVJS_25205 [Nocardioides sp. NPDC057772]|uniref:hypothetical protein n=1 Tax=Nocardioides sp. NPDC057772 TaxID=3346245 RepID=UPI00366CB007
MKRNGTLRARLSVPTFQQQGNPVALLFVHGLPRGGRADLEPIRNLGATEACQLSILVPSEPEIGLDLIPSAARAGQKPGGTTIRPAFR